MALGTQGQKAPSPVIDPVVESAPPAGDPDLAEAPLDGQTNPTEPLHGFGSDHPGPR